MAKQQLPKPTGAALVPVPKNAVALSELDAIAEADAGRGVSTDREDNTVPLVRRLQGLSPQLNPQKPEYVKGAKIGDIYLRDEPEPLTETMLFQPVAFIKDWVEWRPRETGGGIVGRFADLPSSAVEATDPKNGRIIYKTPGGNLLIETRYHVGFVVFPDGRSSPYVIPMKSTDHTISRNWMQRMNQKKLPSGNTAPAWRYLYRLKTTSRTNAAGTWATWAIEDAGPIATVAEYRRGADLFASFTSGERHAERDEEAPISNDGADAPL